MSLKKITDKQGNEIQVDSAIKDGKGQIIHRTYAKDSEVLKGAEINGDALTVSDGIVEIPVENQALQSNSDDLATSKVIANFVNSSINAVAAYYITSNVAGDPFNTVALLKAASTLYSGGSERVPTRNDYAIVLYDETKNTEVSGYASFTTTADYVGYYVLYNNVGTEVTSSNKDSVGIIPSTTIAYTKPFSSSRYSYQGTGTYNGNYWQFQYIINDTAFTAAQLAAINSGATQGLIAKIGSGQISANLTATDLVAAVNELEGEKQDKLTSQTAYANQGSATQVPQITTNSLGQVTNITPVTITDNNDNQKIKAGNVTFGDNDSVEIVGGDNIEVVGDASTKTITVDVTSGDTPSGKVMTSDGAGGVSWEEGGNVKLIETSYLTEIAITYTDSTTGSIESGYAIDSVNYEIYLETID